jgi:Family of unknown function (DUF5947)
MVTKSTQSSAQRPFAALRQLVRPTARVERCELCGVGLASEHPHLVEPANRRLFCSCEACAMLFSGREAPRYRRVPRDVWALPDFRMSDAQWESLHIPINLVFFFYSSPAGRIVALYPAPAGAVESLLPLEAWMELTEDNPDLRKLEPDVEALLVNRVGKTSEYYRAPIDECYKLVGVIRSHWHGLSGGTEVWAAIARFFTELRDKANSDGGGSDA